MVRVRAQETLFQKNHIVGGVETLKLMDAIGTHFVGNLLEDAVTIPFDDAARTAMSGNIGLINIKLKVDKGASLDEKSVYGYEPIYWLFEANFPGTTPRAAFSPKKQ